MGRRGPEGKIQDKVLKYAREHDVLYKKQEVGRFFVSSGWPDTLFFPDRSQRRPHNAPFFMEFKAPGGRLTPLQEERRSQIESRGYTYYVVDSVEQGRQIIDKECM